ncbi:MAG: chemotaxis protein CheX [Brevinema sp.]
MLVNYINPFVEATFEIMSEILHSPVKRGQLHLKKVGENMYDISIIIGVTGNVAGRIIFGMEESTAVKLSEKLNDDTFDSLNELVCSTVSEISNMITGRAVTKLAKENLAFNFSAPTLIIGDKIAVVDTHGVEALVIPIDTGYGMIFINIAFKQ